VSGEPDHFFEEFRPGDLYVTRVRTLTEWDVMTFVTAGGYTEDIWFDQERQMAALGRRGLVPGPLTLILAEGLYVQTGRMRHAAGFLGMDEVRWRAPVAVGDAIRVRVEVREARPSHSKPAVGIVTTSHTVLNQNEEVVLTYLTTRMHDRAPTGS
jgi:acyl dehydratase